MHSLNNQLSPFESLPDFTFNIILDQLNKQTGSKGIINQFDIDVVMRYVTNLACTSKTMAAKVNELGTTHLFLKSLSNKYGESPEHFAALLNTEGARTWLWNYIKENGDDKVYQVIQDIYELAFNVLKEVESAGIDFKRDEARKDWPEPNPYYYQTKQGFVLYNGGCGPSYIATPFGEIKIYTRGVMSGYSYLSVAEVFIKRLNAVFEDISDHEKEVFAITPVGCDTIRKINPEEVKKISRKKLKDRNGIENLIPLTGNYKIREVKGKKVPDVIMWHELESKRSYDLIQRIWEMLEANRLGKDSIKKEIKHKGVISKNIPEVSLWAIEFIQSIIQNWVKSELKDYPNILFTKSEEDYVLFVKKENIFREEYDRINYLTNSLGLSKSIHCYDYWKGESSSGIYLWIKKDILEKALDALNIKRVEKALDEILG